MSMRDTIEELRKQLESDLQSETHARIVLRIFLRSFQDMEDGTCIKNAILALQGQIAAIEQEAQGNK